MPDSRQLQLVWPRLPEEKEAATLEYVSREVPLGRRMTYDYAGGTGCQYGADVFRSMTVAAAGGGRQFATAEEAAHVLSDLARFQSVVFQQAVRALPWLSDLRAWAAGRPQRWVRVGVTVDRVAYGRLQVQLCAEFAEVESLVTRVETCILAIVDSKDWVNFQVLSLANSKARRGRDLTEAPIGLQAQAQVVALLDAIEMCDAILPVEILRWPGLVRGEGCLVDFRERARELVAYRLERAELQHENALTTFQERLAKYIPQLDPAEFGRLVLRAGDNLETLRPTLPGKVAKEPLRSVLKAHFQYRDAAAQWRGLQARAELLAHPAPGKAGERLVQELKFPELLPG